MKRLAAIILLSFITSMAYTQTFDEWFRQKKTQIKYLIDQIAALQVYSSYVEKGFDIAKQGLNAINTIKKGDFSIHDQYFSALKKVNPKIKSYWKAADIITTEYNIIKACHREIKFIHNNPQITGDEIDYFSNTFSNVLDDCGKIINDLSTIVTPGSIELKDDERLKRIDELHNQIVGNKIFQQNISLEINQLAIQRFIDAADVKANKMMFDLN